MRARGAGLGDGLLDLVSVLVGGFSGAAGLSGVSGDVAEASEEDGGGVADPGEDG